MDDGGVTFAEETYTSRSVKAPQKKSLVDKLVDWHIAKDQNAAQYILIGSATLGILFSISLLFVTVKPQTPPGQLPHSAVVQ